MKAIKFLIAMLFLFVVIIFGTSNNEKVSINYWMGKPLLGYETIQPANTAIAVEGETQSITAPVQVPRKLPLWVVLFLCFTIGFLMAYLIMLQDSIRTRTQLRRLKKRLVKTENELQNIRSAAKPESTVKGPVQDNAAGQTNPVI
ncbi:LapA family protein [bacterium]|nr:LapA family protein [bacterium]